jgi:hypothetical protein
MGSSSVVAPRTGEFPAVWKRRFVGWSFLLVWIGVFHIRAGRIRMRTSPGNPEGEY